MSDSSSGVFAPGSRRLAVAALAVVALGCASRLTAAERKPNVIVIVSDDQGYHDLGVQGCKDIPTPHIDSLAANGVRCTNGYVSHPYCSPTRAGLMTGRYQQRFGHEFNPGSPNDRAPGIGLPTTETTIADRMRAAGYKTGAVGKWHLGHAEDKFHPLNRGFDEFFGFLTGAHSYVQSGTGYTAILRGKQEIQETEYLTDAFAREGVAFIDRHKAEPFFLYWAFNAVHVPMEGADKYLKRFPDIKDPKRRTYAAMLAALDDAVGRGLAKLKEAGIENDTLVFFVSDNGGPMTKLGANGSDNTPLKGQKGDTWEGGIRVPFLIKYPGKLPAGKVYDRPVIQLDFLPTALAAAGVAVNPDWKLDGVNLLPYLRGEKADAPHAALFWRFGTQMAVRKGDWKLVRGPDPAGPAAADDAKAKVTPPRLYDLKGDIGETKDLAATNPAAVRDLQATWDAWNKELKPPLWGTRPKGKQPAGRAAPATLNVNPDGTGGALTLAAANGRAAAGDTVLLAGGTYTGADLIAPANSGTAGNLITYRAADAANPPVLTASVGKVAVVLKGNAYVRVEGVKVSGGRPPGVGKDHTQANLNNWVVLTHANHNEFVDNTFEYSNGSGILLNDSSDNKFIHNSARVSGTYDCGFRAGDAKADRMNAVADVLGIGQTSDRNSFENNDMKQGGHNVFRCWGSHNRFVGNTFNNDWTDVYKAERPVGYRVGSIDLGKLDLAPKAGRGHNVFENNKVSGVRRTLVGTSGLAEQPALVLEGTGNVVRGNEFFDNAFDAIRSTSGFANTYVRDNEITGNTFRDNGGAAWTIQDYDNVPGNNTNNVFHDNTVVNGPAVTIEATTGKGTARDILEENKVYDNAGVVGIKIKGETETSVPFVQGKYGGNFFRNRFERR